jgi:hypothetical protein
MSMRPLQSFTGALLLVLSAVSGATPASARTPDVVAAAEARFREGRAAADRGDFEAARVNFAESQRLDPSAGALFNLAYAEERVGLVATAWQHYQEIIGQLPSTDRRLTFARTRVATLAPRLPRLTVRVSAPLPEGATVARDGVDLGERSLGAALPVDPGRHEVVVRAPGYPDRRYEVTLREADAREVIVEPPQPIRPAPLPPPLAPLSPPHADLAPLPPTPLTTPAPSGDSLRPLGWVLGSAGLLGLTLGAVAGIMTFEQKRIMNKHCDINRICDQTGFDAAQRGPVWATLSSVAFAVGAAGTGVGLYFVLRGSGSAKPAGGAGAAGRAFTIAVSSSF